MLKRMMVTIWAIMCLLSVFGQVGTLVDPHMKANQLYEDFSYADSYKLYQYLYDQDTTNSNYLLGLIKCSIRMNNTENSERWIKKLMSTSYDKKKEWYGYLALNALQNEKIEEVKALLDSVENLNTRKYLISSMNNRAAFLSDSSLFQISPAVFNSKASDFSTMLYGSGVAFLSSRERKSWSKVKNLSDNSRYLDFYEFNEDSIPPIRLIESLTGKFHEGPGQTYDFGAKMVFTRSQYRDKSLLRDTDGVNKLSIYFASKLEGKWDAITSWEHNTDEYSFGHPMINEAGDSMIFVADLPDGYGGTDLYWSVLKNGIWSTPKNLGEQFNSSGNEMFPTLVDPNTISFASNGWAGLGGLDIFIQKRNTLEDPENIGAPINSSKDDFSLIFTDDNQGYFSSSREGNDDIYMFAASYSELDFIVFDPVLNELLIDAQVTIAAEGVFQKQVTSGANGKYSVRLPNVASADVTVKALNYSELNESYSIRSFPDTLFISRPYMELVITDTMDQRIKNAIHYLHEVGHTKTLNTEENRYYLEDGKSYVYFASASGFYSRRDTMNYLSTDDMQRFNVILNPVVIGESITLKNIYYEVNKAELTEASKAELNKLVQFMKDNSEIQIELSSHTDSRGSDSYNLLLSQRRAQSSADYLISHGISESRIIPKGYGESKPINHCVNGISCTSEEYQKNRRTEIKILK